MNHGLTMPSDELARHLLSEVRYEDRLTGVSMHCLQGPTQANIYSLATAVRFLYMDDLDALRDPTSGAYLGYIDPKALVWWLSNVFGDTELADAVDAEVEGLKSYVQMLVPMRRLLETRLEQCDTLLGAPLAAAG